MLRKIIATVLILLILTISASADNTAPTTYSIGYKLWGKYWDFMGNLGAVNGTMNNITLTNSSFGGNASGAYSLNVSNSTGILNISNGGTSATTATQALANLGIITYNSTGSFLGLAATNGTTSGTVQGPNTTYMSSFLANQTFNATNITIYYISAPSGAARVGIYTNNASNMPNVLLTQSENTTLSMNITISFPSFVVNQSSVYWIAYNQNVSNSIYSTADGHGKYTVHAFGSFPSPLTEVMFEANTIKAEIGGNKTIQYLILG